MLPSKFKRVGDGDFLREILPDCDIQLAPVDAADAAGLQVEPVEFAVDARGEVPQGPGDKARENAGGIRGRWWSSPERERSSSTDCGILGVALMLLVGLGQGGDGEAEAFTSSNWALKHWSQRL
jgi:hypothetical protein